MAGPHSSGLKPSATPVAGVLICSSDLRGHLAPTWYTFLHSGKAIIHIIFLIYKEKKNKGRERKEIHREKQGEKQLGRKEKRSYL